MPGDTVKLPPCASTIDLQIAKPIPMPCGFVVKKGSKMRLMFLASMPVPESSNDINIRLVSAIPDFTRNSLVRSPNCTHRVSRISNDVRNYLLKLASMTVDQWQSCGQLKIDRDIGRLEVAAKYRDGVSYDFIRIDKRPLLVIPGKHRLNRLDHLASTMTVPHNIFESLMSLIENGLRPV
jgi:hypothetical protein